MIEYKYKYKYIYIYLLNSLLYNFAKQNLPLTAHSLRLAISGGCYVCDDYYYFGHLDGVAVVVVVGGDDCWGSDGRLKRKLDVG